MAVYSIRDLEKLSGIKAHTIRIWEKRYNLIDPHRTNTNIRCYTDEDLKKILNVAVLNRQGIKISNIARLNDLELKEEIIRVSKINHSQENLIDSMVISTIDFDEYKLEGLIDKSIQKLGFLATVKEVIYPFLEKIGILWQSGDLYPAQEHFVSYLVRQKMIASIDQLPNTFNPRAKKFLMLLPEGEWHELSLIFAQYIIREARHETIYLGQSVPYMDVLALGAAKEFDYILVSSITSHLKNEYLQYLKDLGGAFPDKKILFFARFMEDETEGLGEQHIQLQEIHDLIHFLDNLG